MSVRRGFAISGAAFAALLAAAGGVVMLSLHQWMDPAHRHTSTQHHSGVSRLTVDSGSGDVTIAAAPDGTSTVAVTRHLSWNRVAPRVSEKKQGHTLVVSASCPSESHVGFDTCRVSLTITVPAGTPVSAHAGSGDMTVRDLSGPVRIDDGDGNVQLANLSGSVQVEANDGNVVGSGLRSPRVRTSTDDGNTTLTFSDVPDSVSASSSSGNMTVAVPEAADGYAIHHKVGDGGTNIHVPDRSGAPHRIDLTVGDGNLTLDYSG